MMREKKEINIEIGGQVKIAREEAKLTQEQLAERIDVSPQYISDLERGVVGISLATLRRLCVTLGISADQILFGKTRLEGDFSALERKCRDLSEEQYQLLLGMVDRFVAAIELERKNKISGS